MEAPAFWSNPPDRPGLAARLLWPASLMWQIGGALRGAGQSADHPGVPVICVGNLTLGGSGKTPLVAALAERLQAGTGDAGTGDAGTGDVHVVSRGYGGRLRGPVRVDPVRHGAADVGDEPLLLAATLPVWVARNRAAGARAAREAGAEIVLLDDGFQNPTLRKDLSILAVDAAAGFGNGRVMPAGPLREPIARGLARAQAICLLGAPEERAACLTRWPEIAPLPRLEAALEPPATGLDLTGMPVIAFAGIGRPGKFFDTLESLGARLVARHAFPDHHPYTERVARRLVAEARGQGAMLVTTEKDAVRLPPNLRGEVMALPVRLIAEAWDAVDTLLDKILKGIKKPGATKLP